MDKFSVKFGLSLVLMIAAMSGCSSWPFASSPQVLNIQSDPAEAQVCIKGRSKNSVIPRREVCVGQTPYSADRIELKRPDGSYRIIKFKDLSANTDSFYAIIKRKGYAPKAVAVPGWTHSVRLEAEGGWNCAMGQSAKAWGRVEIDSKPSGALVYIDDLLKGNTPFTYKGPIGGVGLKLELPGYQTFEQAVTVQAHPVRVTFPLTPIGH